MTIGNKKIGFMQGRLSEIIGGKIQAFPWNEWKSEFKKASEIDLSIMEWTLDHQNLSNNPIMTSHGRKIINELSSRYNLLIPSLTGDCFMQAPFWKTTPSKAQNLLSDFDSILRSSREAGIKMVLIPLVDNGAINNKKEEDFLYSKCIEFEDFLKNNNMSVIFESDYSPIKLEKFIDRFPLDQFGINYDIGNSAALGFDPSEEFKAYGASILNIHVKDRLFKGSTVPLGEGSANFHKVFEHLHEIDYQGNFILQTARSNNDDHLGVLKKYKEMTLQWIIESGI